MRSFIWKVEHFSGYKLLDYGERSAGAGGQPPAALQGQGGDGEEQLQALHGRRLQDGFNQIMPVVDSKKLKMALKPADPGMLLVV